MSIISRLERLIEVPEYIKEDSTRFFDYDEFLAQFQPSTTSYFDMGIVKKRMNEWKWKESMPIVRRVVPGLIATELVGVQPMFDHVAAIKLLMDIRNDNLESLRGSIAEEQIANTIIQIPKPQKFTVKWDTDNVRSHIADQPVLTLTQPKARLRAHDPRHVVDGGDFIPQTFEQEYMSDFYRYSVDFNNTRFKIHE